MRRENLTLCLIVNNNEILLQRRKRFPFIEKWNAPGGKVKQYETVECACIREVKEETGLVISSPRLIASVRFADKIDSNENISMYVFFTDKFSGEIISSEEGDVAWLPIKYLFNRSKDEFAFALDWFLDIGLTCEQEVIEMVF